MTKLNFYMLQVWGIEVDVHPTEGLFSINISLKCPNFTKKEKKTVHVFRQPIINGSRVWNHQDDVVTIYFQRYTENAF